MNGFPRKIICGTVFASSLLVMQSSVFAWSDNTVNVIPEKFSDQQYTFRPDPRFDRPSSTFHASPYLSESAADGWRWRTATSERRDYQQSGDYYYRKPSGYSYYADEYQRAALKYGGQSARRYDHGYAYRGSHYQPQNRGYASGYQSVDYGRSYYSNRYPASTQNRSVYRVSDPLYAFANDVDYYAAPYSYDYLY